MSDFRADDADGLTEAGMKRMIEWLHNVREGQVALKADVFMCDLLAYEIERLWERIERYKAALHVALEGPSNVQKNMRNNGIVDVGIDDLDEPMQRFAFTVYAELVAASDAADRALEADDE